MKDYFLKLLPERKPRCLKTAELVCERCQNKFTVPFWMVKKGRRFCSQKCRKQSPLARLLAQTKIAPDGCWNWQGIVGWGGYGQMKLNGIMQSTHRLMWAIWNESRIPKGLVVRHKCIDNRRCINPDHLEPGTQKENIGDAIRQGRFRVAVGVERRCSKLNAEQVRQIRSMRPFGTQSEAAQYTYYRLAKMFKVRIGIIWQVVNNKTYKNI